MTQVDDVAEADVHAHVRGEIRIGIVWSILPVAMASRRPAALPVRGRRGRVGNERRADVHLALGRPLFGLLPVDEYDHHRQTIPVRSISRF